MSREIMRFADTFQLCIMVEAFTIRQQLPEDPALRWRMVALNLEAVTATTQIASAPNPVENLLGMLVLTSLTRHTIDHHLVPHVLNPRQEGLGHGLSTAAAKLETEAWQLSARVLTPQQQDQLRGLIDQWIEEHPNQFDTWLERFSNFSGPDIERLAQVTRTGGLLNAFTDAAQDVEHIVDRMAYLSQKMPNIVRLQAQMAAFDMLQQPEVIQALTNYDELTQVSRSVSDSISELPGQLAEQRAQAIEQISTERVQMMQAITTEREQTLKQTISLLAVEREQALTQALEGVARERSAALEDMAAHLFDDQDSLIQSVFENVDQQRGDLTPQAESLIDRVFLLAAGLVALSAVLIVLTVLACRVVRRRLPAN